MKIINKLKKVGGKRGEFSVMSFCFLVSTFTIIMFSYNIVNDYARENRLLRAIASDQALILHNKRINFTSVHELELERQKYNKLLESMYE